MPCHVMPCHDTSRHVTSRHVASRHVMSCHAMPCLVKSLQATQYWYDVRGCLTAAGSKDGVSDPWPAFNAPHRVQRQTEDALHIIHNKKQIPPTLAETKNYLVLQEPNWEASGRRGSCTCTMRVQKLGSVPCVQLPQQVSCHVGKPRTMRGRKHCAASY